MISFSIAGRRRVSASGDVAGWMSGEDGPALFALLTAMVNVLLLRQPSEDVADSYEDHFCKAGYHPFSLPALETVHINLDILSDIIRDGLKAKGFDGVIITSQRSCEALGNAFRLLKDEEVGIHRTECMIGEMKTSFQGLG